jgi:hypothetical protein
MSYSSIQADTKIYVDDICKRIDERNNVEFTKERERIIPLIKKAISRLESRGAIQWGLEISILYRAIPYVERYSFLPQSIAHIIRFANSLR